MKNGTEFLVDRRWTKGRCCLIFLAGCWLLLPGICLAGANQMFEEYGVSPRDTGMGNAFTALADSYAAAYYNPAGLSLIVGNQADLGYKGVYSDLKMQLSPDPGRDMAGSTSTDFLVVGLASDLHFPDAINEKVTDRLSFGMALAMSKYMKSFTIPSDRNAPYFLRYQDRPVSQLSVYFGGGIEIFEWFRIGAGLNFASSESYTDVITYTDVMLPSLEYESNSGLMALAWSKLKPLLGTVFLIPINGDYDKLRLALAWHDEVFTVDGSGEFTTINRLVFQESGEIVEAPLATQELHQLSSFAPMNLTLGLCWMPTKKTVVAADGIWKRWSTWRCAAEVKPHPRLIDTYHVRFGYEHRFDIDWSWVTGLLTRTGAYYEPSPVRNMNGEMNILDPNKVVGSLGLGFVFNDPLQVFLRPMNFDMAYQMHYLFDSHLHNRQDPTFGPIDYGGQLHTFAATVGVKF